MAHLTEEQKARQALHAPAATGVLAAQTPGAKPVCVMRRDTVEVYGSKARRRAAKREHDEIRAARRRAIG